MNAAVIGLVVLAVAGQQTAETPATSSSAKATARRLLDLHTNDAASFAIFRDATRQQKLELRRESIYRWTNPTRNGGQMGEVFVWTDRGRPEVVGSIFSHPTDDGRRMICHELHSLSPGVLTVEREAAERWIPQAPGVEPKPVEGAPAPAGTAAQRLAQMRTISREFTGRSLSDRNQAWELRLLPHPLYRYESPDP